MRKTRTFSDNRRRNEASVPAGTDDDEYMRRIRARADIEPSDDDGDVDGGEQGALPEEEHEEVYRGWGDAEPHLTAGLDDGEVDGGNEDADDATEDDDAEDDDDDDDDDGYESESTGDASTALKSLPLAERLALLASGHDTRPRSGTVMADNGRHGRQTAAGSKGGQHDKVPPKPKSKKRPKELPSNKPVGRFRVVVEPMQSRTKLRDPRFDPAVGEVNYQSFRQAYKFLDGYQDREISELKATMKKTKSQEKRQEIKAVLTKLQQQKGERHRHDRKVEVLQRAKREEREKVAAGKQPFYLKKRERRRLELEDRYEELARQGKLEKALEKKRKRNAAKDHRWLPRTRRRAEDAV